MDKPSRLFHAIPAPVLRDKIGHGATLRCAVLFVQAEWIADRQTVQAKHETDEGKDGAVMAAAFPLSVLPLQAAIARGSAHADTLAAKR